MHPQMEKRLAQVLKCEVSERPRGIKDIKTALQAVKEQTLLKRKEELKHG